MFAGGWSLAAAEAVCGAPGEPDVLDALSALLDASLLLEFDRSATEPRLHMLETVRTYAAGEAGRLARTAPASSAATARGCWR